VKSKSSTETYFHTYDQQLDRTLQWSKAILTSNAHYLDGVIVPMPCPAEYNFFFTHDLLMTNLGAVNFDLKRVKENLLYVASLAKDSIIPHAYYWKDDGFKTEFCTPSNWNHLWFIEVSASYLRHSLDTMTIRKLYPLITKSLTEIMTQLKEDHLMHAYRPDWWDLGWKEGSRTYITALTIRAIEDYLFMASMIDRSNRWLKGLEKNSTEMRSALVSTLWDDSLHYLINYNGMDKDKHKYMGSLLAPAYHLLDLERSQKMIESVNKDLMARDLGIRAVTPADFHKDSIINYFKIAGNEAGDEYTYINGGVWPHNNAWYALTLHSIGKDDEALSFVKKTMTIDGIANSPNGIPALYEYRYSNESSPRYGEIDKPSFLWAGGFYLYTMYSLAGMTDNVWNLSISENRGSFDSTLQLSYTFGNVKDISLKGKGNLLESLTSQGKAIPSLVLPLDQQSWTRLEVTFGEMKNPYLSNTNAIVHSIVYDESKKELTCIVSSFEGHTTTVHIIGKMYPRQVLLNGKPSKYIMKSDKQNSAVEFSSSFIAGKTKDIIMVKW
jgi:glycogen debranching enzyme